MLLTYMVTQSLKCYLMIDMRHGHPDLYMNKLEEIL